MSIALMIDPQGDADIIKAHEKFRKTLDEWIPTILAAQEPDIGELKKVYKELEFYSLLKEVGLVRADLAS